MDVLLHYADEYAFDRVYAYLLPYPQTPSSISVSTFNTTSYPSSTTYNPSQLSAGGAAAAESLWARDNIWRQLISMYTVALVGSLILYYSICSFSYFLFFDKRLKYHPRYLKNQIAMEIKSSMIAAPTIDLITLPWFLGEIRGKSLLYERVDEYGWPFLFLSVGLYLFFNDFCIYWIHRLEHHPRIYKYIHKPHHKWIIPTPWSALAFHPLDGYAQSLPYHIFVYICPMQKHLYMTLFVMVQIWTIFIHDGDMVHGTWWEQYINSPAHHTLHHLYFTCNYGQYFTWADSHYDSYRAPVPELDPLVAALEVMRKKGLVDEAGNPIETKKDI